MAVCNELIPPSKWGPLPWTATDGTTPQAARDILKRCVNRVGEVPCAKFLHVGENAIITYLANERSIPKHVGEKVNACLEWCLKQSPVKGAKAKTQEPFSNHDVNAMAANRAGAAIRRARLERGLTQAEVAASLGLAAPTFNHFELFGVSPRSRFFFQVCELLNLNPESFGFVGIQHRTITNYLNAQPRQKQK